MFRDTPRVSLQIIRNPHAFLRHTKKVIRGDCPVRLVEDPSSGLPSGPFHVASKPAEVACGHADPPSKFFEGHVMSREVIGQSHGAAKLAPGTNCLSSKIARGAVVLCEPPCDPLGMPPQKRALRKHFIREWRQRANMTLDEVAAETGLSTSHISRMERGESKYSQKSLEALARALKINTQDLHINPNDPEFSRLFALYNAMTPEQRDQAIRLIEAFISSGRRFG